MRRRVKCEPGSLFHSLTEKGIDGFVHECFTLTFFVCVLVLALRVLAC